MKQTSNLLKQTIVLLVICSFAIGFQSCDEKVDQEEQVVTEFDLTTAKTEIEAASQNLMALLTAGDSVGIANCYTADAKFMSPEMPSIIGRANIQANMSRTIEAGVSKIDIKLENLYGTANLLAEEGELTVFVGDNVVQALKFIVLWKKEDGKWKRFREIFNSSSPAE